MKFSTKSATLNQGACMHPNMKGALKTPPSILHIMFTYVDISGFDLICEYGGSESNENDFDGLDRFI